MSMFKEMAMALAERGSIDTDEQLSELKNQKDSLTQFFNLQISQLELQKNEEKAVKDQMKFEEKRDKLRRDLIKSYLDSQGSGSIAIGDDLLGQFSGPEQQPDAQGLPILDGIA